MSVERMLFWTKVSPSKTLILHFSKLTHLRLIMIVWMLNPRLALNASTFHHKIFPSFVRSRGNISKVKWQEFLHFYSTKEVAWDSAFLQQKINDRKFCIFTAGKKWQELLHFTATNKWQDNLQLYSSKEMTWDSVFLQQQRNDRRFCIFTAVKKL